MSDERIEDVERRGAKRHVVRLMLLGNLRSLLSSPLASPQRGRAQAAKRQHAGQPRSREEEERLLHSTLE